MSKQFNADQAPGSSLGSQMPADIPVVDIKRRAWISGYESWYRRANSVEVPGITMKGNQTFEVTTPISTGGVGIEKTRQVVAVLKAIGQRTGVENFLVEVSSQSREEKFRPSTRPESMFMRTQSLWGTGVKLTVKVAEGNLEPDTKEKIAYAVAETLVDGRIGRNTAVPVTSDPIFKKLVELIPEQGRPRQG